MDALKAYREEIDELDELLMKTLEKRFDIVKRIKEHKAKHNLPVLDRAREDAIFDKAKSTKHSDAITAVIETVLRESKRLQG